MKTQFIDHNVSVQPRTLFRRWKRVLVWAETLWSINCVFIYCGVYLSLVDVVCMNGMTSCGPDLTPCLIVLYGWVKEEAYCTKKNTELTFHEHSLYVVPFLPLFHHIFFLSSFIYRLIYISI